MKLDTLNVFSGCLSIIRQLDCNIFKSNQTDDTWQLVSKESRWIKSTAGHRTKKRLNWPFEHTYFKYLRPLCKNPWTPLSEWPSDLFSSSLSEEHSGSALVIFTCGPCHWKAPRGSPGAHRRLTPPPVWQCLWDRRRMNDRERRGWIGGVGEEVRGGDQRRGVTPCGQK